MSCCRLCFTFSAILGLIAYSSVAHMGIDIGGIITMSYRGFCGSFTLIIAHGLCSSGLFCLANISYERLGSRRLLISREMLSLIPRISF
jgi:NADH-ubiquinone oxidoreductase chain 4